jgi:Flp pilus assembly protein CpaB
MFEGQFITGVDIGRRVLTEAELKHYNEHKDQYFTDPYEVFGRYIARTVAGGKPLQRDDLKPPMMPSPLNEHLLPGTRAIDINVTKQDSAGWLLSTGDWVDVHVITNVSRTDDPTAVRRAGVVVRNALIVARRDSLVPLNTPYGKSEYFAYTLSMNPYRAALLEYVRTLGDITLEPVSKEEKVRLDKLRKEAGDDLTKIALITVGDPNTREGMEEASRLEQFAINRGLSIGTDDMMKVLQLRPIEPPTVFIPPVVKVEMFTGTQQHAPYEFVMGKPEIVNAPRSAPQYLFSNPKDSVRIEGGGAGTGGYNVKSQGLTPAPVAPKGGLVPPRR